MRVLALVAAMFLIVALSAGGAILVASNAPNSWVWTYGAPVAITLLAVGPLLAGSFLSFWDVRRSTAARERFRRLAWLLVGFQVLGDLVLVVLVISTGAAWWLPIPFALIGAALTAAALVIGPALYRGDARHGWNGHTARSAYSRDDLRRDIVRISVAAATAFLVIVVVTATIRLTLGDVFAWREGIAFAFVFALMAASVTSNVIVFRLARAQRAVVDGDVDRLRRISKAVVQGKADSLPEGDRATASNYAAVGWISQAYTLASLSGLYTSLGIMQVITLLGGSSNPLTVVLLVLFAVGLVVLVPLMGRQIHRTRQYAIAHPVAPVGGGAGPPPYEPETELGASREA